MNERACGSHNRERPKSIRVAEAPVMQYRSSDAPMW
jgi:hypothetical protein